ncbi:hypothetical protein [Methylophaga muralis]|uniref:Uncharacterized protein n=1 Tax=Methylophaga muralis TaxID=291169 RepID=A0A1E3GN72_9GAMM|nr:hypothetical protein [Methylophaga muralis]ODN65405.1 hypothetical protein A9E74_02795 [Methylophaga muralis]
MNDKPIVNMPEDDEPDFSQAESLKERRDLILTHKEAQAGSRMIWLLVVRKMSGRVWSF